MNDSDWIKTASACCILVAIFSAFITYGFLCDKEDNFEYSCRANKVILLDGQFYQCIEVKTVAAQGVNKNEQ